MPNPLPRVSALRPSGFWVGRMTTMAVVENAPGRAVGAVGQLPENTQRGVRAALLIAVHVACDPEDGGRGRGEARDLGRRRGGIAQALGGGRDPGQRRRGHIVRQADNGVAQRPAAETGGKHAVDDAGRRARHRQQIAVRLGDRDVALAEVDAEKRARRRHGAGKDRRGAGGVASGRGSIDGEFDRKASRQEPCTKQSARAISSGADQTSASLTSLHGWTTHHA